MPNPLRMLVRSIAKDAARGWAGFAISSKADILRTELQRRATLEAADFVCEQMPEAMFCSDRLSHIGFALGKRAPGLVMEFCVYKGVSINFIADHLKGETVYGFDSFEGLPEDWIGNRFSASNFNRGGRAPRVCGNVELIKGWFEDTLPSFLREHADSIGFIHLDADLYSSTKTVLDLTWDRMQQGTVIVFDEFFNYYGYAMHEYRAFFEFVKQRKVEYRFIGYSGAQVSLVVNKIGN